MGEYGTTDEMHPTTTSLQQVFAGFKDHFNGNRASTELTMLELLKKCHPESHITCTSQETCDLLGYATAGNATATLDFDEALDATRSYKAPRGSRHQNKNGVLKNHIRFGRWRYTWERSDFLVYEIEYSEFSRPVKLYYVLAPRTEDGISKKNDVCTDELLLAIGAWSTELHEEIFVFDNGFWTKSHELWQSVQDSTWNEVILNRDMKKNLIQDVSAFFDNQQLYKKLAVPWKRGLIFHGVPGNGKTISIKALINALSARSEPVPSLYVKSLDACQGEKYAVRSIFAQARLMAPCLLIFEDLDSLVGDKIRSYFLNEVDGLESNDGILMIGSTNHLNALDPAISKRPSRFDRKYHFKIPNQEERTEYCRFWRRKLEDSDMVEFREELCPVIAKLTEGFSFAYLKELFVIALLTIARGGGYEEENEEVVIVAKEEALLSEDTSGEKATSECPEGVEDSTTSTDPPAQNKRIVPEVEIPESLKDNLLLKVIQSQTKMLLDEMDNTKEDDFPSSKISAGVTVKPRIRGHVHAVRIARE